MWQQITGGLKKRNFPKFPQHQIFYSIWPRKTSPGEIWAILTRWKTQTPDLRNSRILLNISDGSKLGKVLEEFAQISENIWHSKTYSIISLPRFIFIDEKNNRPFLIFWKGFKFVRKKICKFSLTLVHILETSFGKSAI